MIKNCLTCSFFLLLACSGRNQESIAHITQRRLKASGSLVISYQFRQGASLFKDSMEIPNRIVPHDSVKVVFASGNPSKSHLVLP
ncbi:MAG: hypothetical protein V4450_11705 [Bacteroidota bacterium]